MFSIVSGISLLLVKASTEWGFSNGRPSEARRSGKRLSRGSKGDKLLHNDRINKRGTTEVARQGREVTDSVSVCVAARCARAACHRRLWDREGFQRLLSSIQVLQAGPWPWPRQLPNLGQSCHDHIGSNVAAVAGACDDVRRRAHVGSDVLIKKVEAVPAPRRRTHAVGPTWGLRTEAHAPACKRPACPPPSPPA